MKFRPCIDIHNGKVKQIVGGTLKDQGDCAVENFVSVQDAAYYARLYQKDGLQGGHIILLNAKDSRYYEATKREAFAALAAYPGGMQIGGGIDADNAKEFLCAGASHVIVTSYVFRNGYLEWENLKRLCRVVGKKQIVLDVSCRKKEGVYYIVTDRWQNFTEVKLDAQVLDELSLYCDEFLVHGVDVEGKVAGIEEPLVRMLADWGNAAVTYAGGIGTLAQLRRFLEVSRGKLDFTIGSALDLFGGELPYEEVKHMLW